MIYEIDFVARTGVDRFEFKKVFRNQRQSDSAEIDISLISTTGDAERFADAAVAQFKFDNRATHENRTANDAKRGEKASVICSEKSISGGEWDAVEADRDPHERSAVLFQELFACPFCRRWSFVGDGRRIARGTPVAACTS